MNAKVGLLYLRVGPIVPGERRKHYAKWSQARQQRITELYEAIYPGTFVVRGEKGSVIN
jgi:hypothetical protein